MNESILYLRPVFLPVLFVLILFPSCQKKQKESGPQHYYIPDAYKSWVYYNPGTYWVYLNEKTGEQDCTYVAESSDTTYSHHGDHDLYEVAWSSLKGNVFTSIYTEAYNDDYVGTSFHLKNHNTDYVRVTYQLLLNPHMTSYFDNELIYDQGISEVFPTEVINGNSFSNVYNIHGAWLNTWGDSLVTDAQLVRNIGIVKLRTYQEGADTTWSLLRWNVVQ